MTLTEDGQPASVLLPAAELAELEHWAQRAYGALIPAGHGRGTAARTGAARPVHAVRARGR
ncbi:MULTISPECIES: hypothetical protein [unclassified Streptomyces]|uniref:hypothetical protein n=1 Tax=unclassified Streptomyces TaxID=2593676 RepID=UPI002DD9173C|nr:hypothetical protein [Streptomyces sp. NBC_01750]WSB05033.1 hypothetical protein OIE54_41035 [Streptomyces sp. NBC_01794]WSD30695.1 hypothetical protein OG966_01085 [Streptomyces sp. NBC_01750]